MVAVISTVYYIYYFALYTSFDEGPRRWGGRYRSSYPL